MYDWIHGTIEYDYQYEWEHTIDINQMEMVTLVLEWMQSNSSRKLIPSFV